MHQVVLGCKKLSFSGVHYRIHNDTYCIILYMHGEHVCRFSSRAEPNLADIWMVTCSILQLWLNAASVRSEKFDSQERSGCAYSFLEPTSQQNMFDCHGDFNVTAAKTRSYAADLLASSIVQWYTWTHFRFELELLKELSGWDGRKEQLDCTVIYLVVRK